MQAVPMGQPASESLLAATELSNPVQALMDILGSESTSAESCLPSSATLRHMVMHTVQLCTAAFARSPTAISTTIKPLTHLALASQLPKTPFPPATSIWVPTGHCTGTTRPACCCCQCFCRAENDFASACRAITVFTSWSFPMAHFPLQSRVDDGLFELHCILPAPLHIVRVGFLLCCMAQICPAANWQHCCTGQVEPAQPQRISLYMKHGHDTNMTWT